jgi:hypothetical protein
MDALVPLLCNLSGRRDAEAHTRAIDLGLQLRAAQLRQLGIRVRNARTLSHPKRLPGWMNMHKWAIAGVAERYTLPRTSGMAFHLAGARRETWGDADGIFGSLRL